LIGTPSFHERGYELKRRGIDPEKIAERVSGLYGVEPHWIMVRGGEGRRVAARSLLCYWAVRELGMTLTDLARIFGMSPYSYLAWKGFRHLCRGRYQFAGGSTLDKIQIKGGV
jgi:hypothetical protein